MALSASVGFLKAVTDSIRLYIDDPGDSAGFTDQNLLDFIRRAWADVSADVARVSALKIRARVDIAISPDVAEYNLPTNMGHFLSFEKLSDDLKTIEWEVTPRHPLSMWRKAGLTLEGPMLRIFPLWADGHTLRLTYVPNAEAEVFEATGTRDAADTSTTVTSPASPTAGVVDLRPHAYVGYVFRMLASGNADKSVIERVVTGYDPSLTTGQFTVAPALVPNPTAGGESMTWEVLPQHMFRFRDLISLKVSRFAASVTKNLKGAQMLGAEYQDALRSLRLDHAGAEQRIGQRFHKGIRGRSRAGKVI